MAATSLIENWIKAVRGEVERILLTGEKVLGYKLVKGKSGNRKWTDEKDVLRVFSAIKVPKEQRYHTTVISPTDAEKLLLKVAPDRWEKLTPYITRSDGALHVAPESDKRPEVWVLPVADSFGDLTGKDFNINRKVSTMATLKLQNVRLSFFDGFTARPFKEGDKPKFKATFLIPKQSPLHKIVDKEISRVAAEKWPGKSEGYPQDHPHQSQQVLFPGRR